MTNIPENLKYTKEHEWINIDGNSGTIGITDFAQNALGDIVFVELPQEGDSISVGEAFGVIESIKSANDLYSPATGKVVEVNTNLIDSPDLCNNDPYNAWLIKVELEPNQPFSELMDPNDYKKLCDESS